MGEKYVSTRIKAVGSAKAVQGIMHDTRFTVPGYLRRDPEAKFHSFKDNVTVMCRGAKNNAIRDFCRETIMDSVREQQEIYKEKIKQKPDLGGNWAITGVITFSEHAVDGVDNDKLLELGKKTVQKIATELHVKPIYVSLHLDEKTPHLHYQLENLNRETGRTVARTIKTPTLTKLQDIAGEVFEEIGLKRGQSRETTGRRYKTVAEGHREELKQYEKRIQDMQEEIKVYREELKELKRPAVERRSITERFFNHLKEAGVLLTLQRRRWVSGAWSKETAGEYTDLEKIDLGELSNQMHLNAEKMNGCEWHVKTFGLPPVFCLDDLKKADIEKMKWDGIKPLAVVETSPENYQVWVGFKNCFGYPEKQLSAPQWRLVIDYLHEKYGGDPAALVPGHQFRVPGFRRIDKPEWVALLKETGTITDFKPIEKAVMDRLEEVQKKLERTEWIKKVVQENLGASTGIVEGSEDVPEWFIRDKWVRFKTEIMKNPPLTDDGEPDWSRVDFRVVRDILKSTKRPDRLLDYQRYSYLMLKNEGLERNKSRDYAERTLDAVMESMR